MSRETMEYLNGGNILVGHGVTPWWFDASLVDASNSPLYAGAIPVGDVQRRLFEWQGAPRRVAVEVPATLESMTHLSDQGEPMRWDVQLDRQAITRSDTHAVLGLFKDGYQPHQYGEWLVNAVSNLIGDTLGIESAGLLKRGAIAWVHVSTPQSVTNPQGVAFRPRLLCTTSFDGSVATSYKRTYNLAVCDNTREACMAEDGAIFRVKHTRGSVLKIKDARTALGLLEVGAEEFNAEIAELCATTVTDRQWAKFLDELAPLTDKSGEALTGRSLTSASKKQDELRGLWNHDNRVAPWKNTAFGVVQSVNTWGQHFQTVRGSTRVERNMLGEITGTIGKADNEALALLGRVLSNA